MHKLFVPIQLFLYLKCLVKESTNVKRTDPSGCLLSSGNHFWRQSGRLRFATLWRFNAGSEAGDRGRGFIWCGESREFSSPTGIRLRVNGKNVAKDLLAVVEPLTAHHFGDAILDDLFSRFAHEITTRHLLKDQCYYTILVVASKKNAPKPTYK